MKKYRSALFISLTLACAVVYFGHFSHVKSINTFINRLNAIIYDVRIRAHHWASRHDKARTDIAVTIIDIDEKSLEKEGKWPWPRNKLADLVAQLARAQARLIAFDILFPEKDPNLFIQTAKALKNTTQHRIAHTLESLAPEFDHDLQLSKQIKQSPTVLGMLFHNRPVHARGQLGTPFLSLSTHAARMLTIPKMKKYLGNIPLLQDATPYAGFTTITADEDGIIRRAPLLLRYHDALYPALGLESARRFLGIEKVDLKTAQIGDAMTVTGIQLGHIYIPTNANASMLIPFLGAAKSVPYLSATDVLHGQFDKAAVRGKITLIGTSSFGLGDTHNTPFQSNTFPGVETHANVIDAIMTHRFLYVPDWAKGADVMIVSAIGLLFSLLFPFLSSSTMIFFALFLLIGLILGFYPFLWHQGIILPELLPIVQLLLLSSFHAFHGYLTENQRRKHIKNMFGMYVPPEYVEQMLQSEKKYQDSGESKEMTVLFCDIAHFTTISENLDAEQVKQLLNCLFTPLTEIIFDTKGTIDKYVGDMLMAFWGAPLPQPLHAQYAVRAAVTMLARVRTLAPEFKEMGLPEIKIGVGINTGQMHVGDMGSKYRRSYTVLGDAVNLGSRLEALTRFYQVDCLISESTHAQLSDYLCRKVDRVTVKGKKEAIDIFSPLCLHTDASKQQIHMLERYHTSLDHYKKQEWEKAKAILLWLKKNDPNTYLYSFYLDRIQQYEHSPPPDNWDGVYTHKSK